MLFHQIGNLKNTFYVAVKFKDCDSSLQKGKRNLVSHHYLCEHKVMSTENVGDAKQ